jgi:hypothetical protein
MTISELDEAGQQFLIQLFEQTSGDPSAQVSMYDVGEGLGLELVSVPKVPMRLSV